MRQFNILDLGLVDFDLALAKQKEIFSAVKSGLLESTLIVCSHYPVITLGRQAKQENILADPAQLQNIKVRKIERGGDITYHGQGQITCYPIFDLNCFKKDIHWYLRSLEETVIDFLAGLGIPSQRRPGLSGVWIEKRKIASIGISIKNWITFHGISINIKRSDLANFKLIRPCGLDVEMTCAETYLGRDISIEEMKSGLLKHFKITFFQECHPEAQSVGMAMGGKHDQGRFAGIRRRD